MYSIMFDINQTNRLFFYHNTIVVYVTPYFIFTQKSNVKCQQFIKQRFNYIDLLGIINHLKLNLLQLKVVNVNNFKSLSKSDT